MAPAHIDESEAIGESPESYVERLAREKAEAVWRDRPTSFVLGADTTVVVDEAILAKPADAADAARMLRLLSGRSHRVLTGVCLLGPSGFFRASVVSTAVTFERLSEADIAWYVGTGEPLDKAGAYAVQGGRVALRGAYRGLVFERGWAADGGRGAVVQGGGNSGILKAP